MLCGRLCYWFSPLHDLNMHIKSDRPGRGRTKKRRNFTCRNFKKQWRWKLQSFLPKALWLIWHPNQRIQPRPLIIDRWRGCARIRAADSCFIFHFWQHEVALCKLGLPSEETLQYKRQEEKKKLWELPLHILIQDDLCLLPVWQNTRKNISLLR